MNRSYYPSINLLVPSSIGYNRFKIDEENMVLQIMDIMDTNPEMIKTGKLIIRYNNLDIPVEISNYHFDDFSKGDIKAVKVLFKNNQLCLAFSINKEVANI